MTRLRDWLVTLGWRKGLLVGAAGGFLLLVVLLLIGYAVTDVPEPSADAVGQASVIRYAGDGGVIGQVGSQNRVLVGLDEVSDPAQKAVLAAEDRDFYSEPGISAKGIGRALFANVRGGGVEQGGSTITQQYAKNAFLTRERTFSRKVREVFISLKLSHTRSKEQVLEDYLNTIYFGRGASGIEVAAKTYFGRSAKSLSVAQAAVLAASIRSPATYDPTRHTKKAHDRWEYVLNGMVKKGWLTEQERRSVVYPPVLAPGEGAKSAANDRSGPKGYVLDMVEEELAREGFTEDRLAEGGYVVETTLRRQSQEAAVRAVEKALPAPVDQDSIQGALVAVKPKTGEVYAYYGGRKGNGGYDYASQGLRQPGSSFKPYALAAALDNGIGLDSRYDGSSPQDIAGTEVENFNDEQFGRIDLVTATEHSVNTVFFRLAVDVGPKKVADLAHLAGIPGSVALHEKGSNSPAAGIALGQYDVHVIDQAAGYATFGGGGIHATPFFVKRVLKRGGDEVYRAKGETDRAFNEGVAADATYAMQQVVKSGTGTGAALSDGRPTAGKTGTTSDNKDAWFCGFTPQLAAVVWLGRGQPAPMRNVLGVRQVTGGTVPASIWKAFMDAALRGQPHEDFPKRANVGTSSSGSADTPGTPTSGSGRPLPTVTATLPTAAPTAIQTFTAEPPPPASSEPPPPASSEPPPPPASSEPPPPPPSSAAPSAAASGAPPRRD